jgi:hypothetical protein
MTACPGVLKSKRSVAVDVNAMRSRPYAKCAKEL